MSTTWEMLARHGKKGGRLCDQTPKCNTLAKGKPVKRKSSNRLAGLNPPAEGEKKHGKRKEGVGYQKRRNGDPTP